MIATDTQEHRLEIEICYRATRDYA